MKRLGLLISRYLLQAILPYFIFSWLLLSVILFAQQASRYADIFFSVNLPPGLIWQLTLALIPNVIAFTCPMAMLVGTIIGLSRMQGDSELVAIRAAGVGNLQITIPIVLLGIVLSVFAFFVNLKGVPFAARMVRNVAIQTAVKKLESPIEPGVFNTEVAGYTIYVKGGDLQNGTWKNIFIYNEDDANGLVRLITSSNGRIDIRGESSELVLENATVSSFPKQPGSGKFISENINDVRIAIKTKRGELIEKLSSAENTPEELGLSDLAQYAQSKEGSDRTEAQILWLRRIILSITPLLFCLLGSAMILRFNRGGRGFGIFLALIGLIGYYLLAFLGEQLARTGKITVLEGGLIPIAVSIFVILWFALARRIDFWTRWVDALRNAFSRLARPFEKTQTRNFLVDLTTGLRDLDLFVDLLKYFFLTLGFLAAVFVIFTGFELWKFAGMMDGGIFVLTKYLFFLLPFVYLQLAPSAAMIAILATYVIKSRQNEIVTWIAAGQSVYRLLFPCFVLMLLLGFVNWEIQEHIYPKANQIQDQLRDQIRSRGALANRSGKLWVANDKRIFSFELVNNASDNASAFPKCSSTCAVSNLSIFEFDGNRTKLQAVYHVPMAVWEGNRIVFDGSVEKTTIEAGRGTTEVLNGGELTEAANPFAEFRKKPSQMDVNELKGQIASSESAAERKSFFVALDKKYSTLVLPLVIALFTAPFALSLRRKGRVVTVGYAVGLWLVFTGVTNIFEQLGLNGALAPSLAVWGPLAMFCMLGVFLLSKVRT